MSEKDGHFSRKPLVLTLDVIARVSPHVTFIIHTLSFPPKFSLKPQKKVKLRFSYKYLNRRYSAVNVKTYDEVNDMIAGEFCKIEPNF